MSETKRAAEGVSPDGPTESERRDDLASSLGQAAAHSSAGLPAATRGRLRLHADSCTSCMLCVRECPAWCISLTAEKQIDESVAPVGGARKERTRLVLTGFEVDYGLCMYCGICVDVCPFDCLTWEPAPTPSAASNAQLVHGIQRLSPEGD